MAQGTDAMLFGDVKAKETGQHLPYATITVKGTNMKTKCDASGHFKMSDLPVGKQTVVASLEGYQEEELEVLSLSAAGLTMTEVADRMCRSLDSIKTYKRHAFDKLGVANITEAISRAILNKLF